MKAPKRIFSVLAAIVISLSASAAVLTPDLESEKSKTYSKSYPVGSGDRILLDNSFGEMKISTWSKNEIKVEVNITVKANTDEYAQKLIDVISIEDGKTGSEIFFKTHLNHNKNKRDDDGDRKEGKNTSFKINYTVFLPATVTLEANNDFGPMSINDFDGALSLTSKFGSLTAGKLSQPQKIRVEFGKATVESMNGGKLDVRFSKAQVLHLSGEISANLEQSGGVKLGADNNLKKLDLKVNFSKVYLDVEKNISASYTIKSSFGSFHNETEFSIPRQDKADQYVDQNKRYAGKSGSGSTPIDIRNNFGTVTLGHNISFDVNDSSKDKNKKSRA